MYMCASIFISIWRSRVNLSWHSFSGTIVWCLEQGLFIGLEVTELPRVASQGVPGIPLSPPPQSWDHKFM